jgi:hypothetical protein
MMTEAYKIEDYSLLSAIKQSSQFEEIKTEVVGDTTVTLSSTSAMFYVSHEIEGMDGGDFVMVTDPSTPSLPQEGVPSSPPRGNDYRAALKGVSRSPR